MVLRSSTRALLRLVNTERRKSGAFGTGSWTDTPPHVGCCRQRSVALWEPSRYQRLTKSPTLQSAGAALSVNLLKIKSGKNPKQVKKNPSRRSPHGPIGYFVTFSPDLATQSGLMVSPSACTA